MTVFWSLATVMSLLALLFVVVPLLRYRAADSVRSDDLNTAVIRTSLAELDSDLAAGRIEQEQYDAARADLERELLHDLSGTGTNPRPVRSGGWAVLFIAIAIPLGAVLLYKTIGSEQIITLLQQQPAMRQAQQQPGHSAAGQPSLEEMVDRLAARLEQEPDNLEGWVMLARSYTIMNRWGLAVHAYRNILRLGGGDDAALLADFSDALVATNNGRFPEEAGAYLERALELEPENIKALWLAGHWKRQSADPAGAVAYWERAAQQMQPGSRDSQVIDEQIAAARREAGLPRAEAASTAAVVAEATAPAAATAARLEVTVSLEPALAAKARPDDTVFVFARAVNGPRMPLAIVRKEVSDLPVTVVLDDSMAMSPAMVLSAFDPVSVGARISRSGNAMPQSGDLHGLQSPVSIAGETRVEIIIDQTMP